MHAECSVHLWKQGHPFTCDQRYMQKYIRKVGCLAQANESTELFSFLT